MFQEWSYDSTTARMSVDCILDYLRRLSVKYKTNKVVLSGGDPLYINNLEITRQLLDNDEFEFCVYTGSTAEDVEHMGLSGFKFIKCNVYDKNLRQEAGKDDECMTFASSNQELYDSDLNLISTSGKYYFK
jgi:organic radical activating enzyme